MITDSTGNKRSYVAYQLDTVPVTPAYWLAAMLLTDSQSTLDQAYRASE